jgi:hypothetical protein
VTLPRGAQHGLVRMLRGVTLSFHCCRRGGIIPLSPTHQRSVLYPMPFSNQDLRSAGLKVTLPRIKILQILEDSSEHART